MSTDAISQAKKILAKESLSSFEIIPLNRPLSFRHYQEWLEKQQHGKMHYMARNQDVRESPSSHFPDMRSIIVFEQSYFPLHEESSFPLSNLKVAHYARNEDYHHWFRKKLDQLIKSLKESFPKESFLSFTDSVPLLERDYGAQAALGWIGKNTCLIHPKRGSLFFIGEILTSLQATEKPEALHDFCGSCTACIDDCPTQALSHDRVLDANKCISYWNIESREVPPLEMREKMQDWFFGCDICQTVCPWNIKLHKLDKDFPHSQSSTEKKEEELKMILKTSNKKLLAIFKETPLSRAGGRGLKRNALIVIGNLKLQSLRPEVESFLDHESLGELAQWTLKALDS